MLNKPNEPRKALGKGLSALLPNRPAAPRPDSPVAAASPDKPQPTPGPLMVSIDRIDANPLQPRSVFQPDRLRELSQSIEANGIIQPLIVRQSADRFELIAGERRWRAARMAGLTEVPIVVQTTDNDHLLEVSLIENIQREDLNPMEIAQAFDRLHREHHLSHEDIARRTGKDRTTVTNFLRLLRLPPEVQLLVAEHRISMGHAKALLALDGADLQRDLADKTAAQGLSVRQIERMVQDTTKDRASKPDADDKRTDPNVLAAATELERALGTRVRIIEKSEQRGKIEIEYFSQEELDRIYNQIVDGKK